MNDNIVKEKEVNKKEYNELNIAEKKIFAKAKKVGERIQEKMNLYDLNQSEENRISILNDIKYQRDLLTSIGMEALLDEEGEEKEDT